MLVPLSLFTQLAASCAPAVHPDTLAAVARAESGFDALAIHRNGEGGGAESPPTREEAIARASDLIVGQGRSVDLGLMQVNSANLAPLGLTIADAFDPCRSLAAGARLLVEGYRAAPAGGAADPQRALRVALSRYNTGDPAHGFANGYVARVQAAAEQVVPAIRLGDGSSSPPPADGQGEGPAAESGPPSWDVYGQALATRGQGTGLAASASGQPSAPSPAPPPESAPPAVPAAPVLLRASQGAADPPR